MLVNLGTFNKTYLQQVVGCKGKLPISYVYLMLVIYLFAAWMSEGFAHADEHYQILEFATYHIHHYPYIYPWELAAQIRPTLQIWMVIGLYKLALLLSWQIDPFMLAFLTRALTGCLSALSCYGFVSAFQYELNSLSKRKFFFLLSAFGYMALSSAIRFSSETVSAIFFMLGFSLLFYRNINKHALYCFMAGACLGFSFITRYQIGLMIFGLFAWLIVYKEMKFSKFVILLLGFVLVGALGVYLDSLFYGKLTFTVWRYFEVNILQARVAAFGNSSCWTYLKVIFMFPYGLLFVLSTLFFIIKCPKHVITWIMVPFIMVHFIIGHKEMRFLIPILGLMPFVVIYSFQLLEKKFPSQFNELKLRIFHKPLWIFNGFIVFFLVVIDHRDFSMYKYIWAHYNHAPAFLNYINKGELFADNSVMLEMPLRFYVPDSLYMHKISRLESLICNQQSSCLTWVSCDKNVIKNTKNIALVFDSCRLYDGIQAHLKRADWINKSSLFRQNGRLYLIS